MWKLKRSGYYEGCYMWEFKAKGEAGGALRSRAEYFPDGRIGIYLNLHTEFPTSAKRSRKAMSDYFRAKFDVTPRICIVEPRNKTRGQQKFLTVVSFYAFLNEKPDLTGLIEELEPYLVECVYIKHCQDGSVEVRDWTEVSSFLASKINVSAGGKYKMETAYWERF